MADEDEIDILGDFSFNSCLAQNNQGIPSCSDREDTVHPQWLLDSITSNWYDTQNKDKREKDGPSRRLTGNTAEEGTSETHTSWNQMERDLLTREMAKYGRNTRRISQSLKTKTEAEIQALIEAEYGVFLETPSFGLEKNEDQDDTPQVIQEEIVADETSNINNVLNMVTTGKPTIPVPKKPYRKKPSNARSKNSILKPDEQKFDLMAINPSEILYEEDLVIGSTESIGSDVDAIDIVSKNIQKQQRTKIKAAKKVGNHRRKFSRNYDKGKQRSRFKDVLKSPPGRQRKDSGASEENTKSPKLQIVLGSGQSLIVSEGEQVIKLEKKKDSDPESDIDVDIDSDSEVKKPVEQKMPSSVDDAPIAVPLRKFEPMPRRQKKINLDGGGGYTIMHTATGDLYSVSAEPRRERAPRKRPVHLIQCRLYSVDRPAPYIVRMHVSALVAMDAHAHTSRAEVMGLAGGRVLQGLVHVTRYRPAAAAAAGTHCDMDPVSQAVAAEALSSAGAAALAWHHSHPTFPSAPSARDLRTQRTLQDALGHARPLLAIITSQHWPAGRRASQYRCIRVEDPEPDDPSDVPVGYQLSVKLVPDLTVSNLPAYLGELRSVMLGADNTEYTVDMTHDICPQAGITYLEKCISSLSHHMHSAGYEDDDSVTKLLIQGVRDVFR